MDISVNAPFKTYYADLWDEYQYNLESKQLTPMGNFKAPTREEKLSWVSGAWDKISEETVLKGFKRYFVSVKELKSKDCKRKKL